VNGVSDVYLADLTTGSLSRVSILPGGAELSDPIALRGLRVDSGSLVVSLSTEGVLDTRDQNRSPQDPTRGTDAYVWTSSYSSTGLGVPSFTLLSVAGSGSSLQAQGGVDGVDYPELPISLSASGSFFTSSAEGLVEGDTNLSADVFFKATNGSTVQRVAFSTISQLSAGSRLIGASDSGALIAVLTTSPELGASVEAQQLVAVNTNSGQWSVVSKSSAGVPANNWVSKAVVSPLGTQIAFTTAADNLVGSSLPLASQGDLYIAPSGVDSNPTFKAMAQVNWWRSGAAMKGVTLLELGQAKSLVDANAPIQLKAARFDPGGSVAVEVWAKPPGALSKVAFQFRAPSDWQLGYVADTAFANWTKSQSSAGGVFSLQSEGASMVANSLIRLGTLTLIPPASNTALSADLQLSGASVNDLAAPGANLSFARGLSDTVGQWTAASLLADRYSLSVSRSVSDVGNAISSADALAALKIAVGLSPNPGSAPVTMGQFAAADVDRSNSVNSADALNVLKMAVGLSTAPARSFLWFDAGLSKQTVSGAASGFVWTELSSIDIPISGAAGLGIVGVLRGDVDGSWTPPIGG
jgi:hypothetical protein